MSIGKKLIMLALTAALAMSFSALANATSLLADNPNGLTDISFTVSLTDSDSHPEVSFSYSITSASGGPSVALVSDSVTFDLDDTEDKSVSLTIGDASGVTDGLYSYTITQGQINTALYPNFTTSEGNTDALPYYLQLAVKDSKVTQAVLLKATPDASGSNESANKVAGFKNKYTSPPTEISLTGVSLRYAPYLLTLGAGIAFLSLSRRRKEEF